MRSAWSLTLALAACGEPVSLGIGAEPASTGAAETTGAGTEGETGDDRSSWVYEYRERGKYGSIGASALAIADNGDIVATGRFAGSFEFAGVVYTSVDEDLWVARFASDGTPLWFRQFSAPLPYAVDTFGPQSAGNLAFTADGDLLLSPTVLLATDFGSGPLDGDTWDPVVLRMSADGEVVWARRFAGFGGEYTDSYPVFVAAGSDDRVWLVGTLEGLTDLGGGPLWSAGWGDLLIAQLDGAGEHLWSRRHGDGGHQEARAAAAAPGGGIVIAGALEGSLAIADTTITSAGLGDAFLVRLDAAGAPLLARNFGDELDQSATALVVDADGITFAGDFVRAIDLGGGPLTSEPDPKAWEPADAWEQAIFVARLDLDGAHRWSTELHADHDPAEVASLARGSDGTLALAGYSWDRPLQFAGAIDGSGQGSWVAALTADGAPRWLQTVSGTPRVAVDAAGGVVALFNVYWEPIEFAGKPLGAPDRASLIVARRGP